MIDVVEKPLQGEHGLDPALARMLEEGPGPERDYLHCAACSAVISRDSFAVEVNGQHQHFCINPHGFEFRVACYAQALGCAISGDREHADSWFPGYLWRLASCSECQTHLGWYFDREGDHFYGLISDRIQR